MNMEILNSILSSVDLPVLVGITTILMVLALLYFSSARKQSIALHKIEISIKHYEQMNYQLALLLNEQRRANSLLSEMAGIDIPYAPMEMPMNFNPDMNAKGNPGNPGNPRSHHGSPEAQELSSQTKLYVGNIDYAATEAELGAHFARFGQVDFVNIPVNRYTGRARGFGFVTFVSKESAERAISLNGSEFKGRQIQVNFAKERDMAL